MAEKTGRKPWTSVGGSDFGYPWQRSRPWRSPDNYHGIIRWFHKNIPSKHVSFGPELALLWHMCFCYGGQIWSFLTITRKSWGLPEMGHNWPCTQLNYGKPVHATTGPLLGHNCASVVTPATVWWGIKTVQIQNSWLLHHWGFKFKIYQVRHISTVDSAKFS